MKVRISIKQTVEYMAEVEMTQIEFNGWEAQLRGAGMFGDSDLAEEIIATYPDCGLRLGEPNDWGNLSVETFEPVTEASDACD